ncbi:MAG: DMT family transporter [Porphyromonadaceae bacterium]|nr:DMT family transporter [Porphyromonadaceae bacterium]
MKNNKIAKAYIALILAQIFWGISFVWTKELLNNEFNVVFVITVRLLISFALLLAIAFITGQIESIKKDDRKWFFLLAFFEPFLYFIGENYGLKLVDASYAAVFIAIIPVIVPFGLFFLYRQRLSWTNLLGVGISIVGVAILSFGNSIAGTFSIAGVLLLLLAVFSAVGYNLILFKLFHYKPITIIIYQNIIAAVLYLPLFLFINTAELTAMRWTPNTVLALVMLAVFCSSIAFMGYSYAVKTIPIAKASVFANAIPVITIVFAVIIGQETLTISKVVGITIVISGLLISQMISKGEAIDKSHL